jgi:RNA polymerase sigma-70 factor (ECF subfamily)
MASNFGGGKIARDDLASIYEQNYKRIFYLGLNFFQNVEEAEDLVNTTFVQVLRNYQTFQGGSDVATWIYRVALNEALQRRRTIEGQSKKGKRQEVPMEEMINGLITHPQQEAALLRDEYKEKILEACKGLCERCQTIILLWFYEEMGGREIAGILGIPVKELYKKKEQCLLLLKAKLT